MSTYLWWRDYRPRPRPLSATRVNRHDMVTEYLNSCTEEDFIDNYRIDKHGLYYFAEKLKSNSGLVRSTNAGLPIECQLLVALRYYATGNSLNLFKVRHRWTFHVVLCTTVLSMYHLH